MSQHPKNPDMVDYRSHSAVDPFNSATDAEVGKVLVRPIIRIELIYWNAIGNFYFLKIYRKIQIQAFRIIYFEFHFGYCNCFSMFVQTEFIYCLM